MSIKYETHIAALASLREELKSAALNPFHPTAIERLNGLTDSLADAARFEASAKVDETITKALPKPAAKSAPAATK